ncbi:MAG: hypothetical protein ACYCYO_00190 [Bacilli bacterium]
MLYLTFDMDLRERWPDSAWLQYPQMAQETVYQQGDVVVLVEWFVGSRLEVVDLLQRIRKVNARVVYVGNEGNESEEWKRQLVMLGVYDFVFVGAELDLYVIDTMLDRPRTIRDVKAYVPDWQEKAAEPTLVEILEEHDTTPTSALAATAERAQVEGREEAKRSKGLRFWREDREESDGSSEVSTGPTRKVIWGQPDPVRVAVVGDGGAGKSFIALQVAALCQARHWRTAIWEEELHPLVLWAAPEHMHVFDKKPSRGYRVWLETVSGDGRANAWSERARQADVILVVTFADGYRMGRWRAAVMGEDIDETRVLWVVNHHAPEAPLPVERWNNMVAIPHDTRHVAAARLRQPLVLTDPRFGAYFAPILDELETAVGAKGKGKEVTADVALARI